jgi:DNA-binding MurR/RpiR family transcriptional regulator
MLIRERLERSHFSSSEKIIVDYILDKKLEIRNMTTKEIANATYTSPSTLIRIAHKMNFKGWNELKAAYIKEEEYLESHFSDIDANFPFTNKDSIMSISSKIATLKKEAIYDTLSLINHDDLQKAISIIRKSSSIQLYAVSNNLYISQKFKHNMNRIRKRVDICSTQGELVYSACNGDINSCAIIISYSGETPILKKVALALKAQNIPMICITNIGDNTIAKLADCILRICTREKLYSNFLLIVLLLIY